MDFDDDLFSFEPSICHPTIVFRHKPVSLWTLRTTRADMVKRRRPRENLLYSKMGKSRISYVKTLRTVTDVHNVSSVRRRDVHALPTKRATSSTSASKTLPRETRRDEIGWNIIFPRAVGTKTVRRGRQTRAYHTHASVRAVRLSIRTYTSRRAWCAPACPPPHCVRSRRLNFSERNLFANENKKTKTDTPPLIRAKSASTCARVVGGVPPVTHVTIRKQRDVYIAPAKRFSKSIFPLNDILTPSPCTLHINTVSQTKPLVSNENVTSNFVRIPPLIQRARSRCTVRRNVGLRAV